MNLNIKTFFQSFWTFLKATFQFFQKRWERYFPQKTEMYQPIEVLKDYISELSLKEKLLNAIEGSIGQDLDKSVSNDLACVAQLCKVLQKVMDFPDLTYTPVLVRELKKDTRFESTLDLDVGNIIVNATGTGNNIILGHCGFIWKDNRVVSNNSLTGKMDTYYDLETWRQRYRIKGQMPTLIFKLKV